MTQNRKPGGWLLIDSSGPVTRLGVLVPESWRAWLGQTHGPVWYIFMLEVPAETSYEMRAVTLATPGVTDGRSTG